MVLIITGSIAPAVDDSQLVVKDQVQRLQQYMDSITFLLQSKAFHKVVFGESSHYPKESLEQLFKIAEENDVQFEYLTFSGNAGKVRLQGKGYGEGEIMDYVFTHSELIKGEADFMKITGRLKVDNILDIVKRCKPGHLYFNIPNRTIREWYDTRVYAMPAELFTQSFQKEYVHVDDEKGKYLEVVYTEQIKNKQLKVKNFPRYPRIVGKSGSTGAQYVYTEWKCKIKDIFSIFQCYKVK